MWGQMNSTFCISTFWTLTSNLMYVAPRKSIFPSRNHFTGNKWHKSCQVTCYRTRSKTWRNTYLTAPSGRTRGTQLSRPSWCQNGRNQNDKWERGGSEILLPINVVAQALIYDRHNFLKSNTRCGKMTLLAMMILPLNGFITFLST
jgi:hypothetical protein